MKVISVRTYSVEADDFAKSGKVFEGVTVYAKVPAVGADGVLINEVVKVSIANQVLEECGYMPEVGHDILTFVNEKGRCTFVAKDV